MKSIARNMINKSTKALIFNYVLSLPSNNKPEKIAKNHDIANTSAQFI